MAIEICMFCYKPFKGRNKCKCGDILDKVFWCDLTQQQKAWYRNKFLRG